MMSDPDKDEKDTAVDQPEPSQTVAPEAERVEERMEDEEKIIDGRHDVNYPALLTKDVPGG
jgi:hypothetical protein